MNMKMKNIGEELAKFVELEMEKMESTNREKAAKFRKIILDAWIIKKMQEHKKD